jgi:leader peptidase (prepilin peptidase) / N-methyltransferase
MAANRERPYRWVMTDVGVWWGWASPGFLVLVVALSVLSIIDLRTHRLPRRIIYMAALVGLPWLVVHAAVHGEPARVVTMTTGAVGALVAFWLIYVAARGGFGDGDVRLAPLLGAYLGFVDLSHAIVGLFMGFVLAALTGLGLMVAGRAHRRTALPFGPFMAVGALVTLVTGPMFL